MTFPTNRKFSKRDHELTIAYQQVLKEKVVDLSVKYCSFQRLQSLKSKHLKHSIKSVLIGKPLDY